MIDGTDISMNPEHKMPNPLRKQIPRFIVTGISAVATDTIVYFILIHQFDHTFAKTISFFCGTVLAYGLNKHWTFEKKEKNNKELIGFLSLYGFTLLVNVGVNRLGLMMLDGFPMHVVIAFLLATGTSTVLNFIGQKWLIFKK